MKNVKCARCVKCGKEYEAVPNLTNCECGGILDIIYDYDYIKAHFTKETLKNRVNPTMWRYRELLPVEETTPDTPLRVGWSPLYEEPKLAELLGIKKLWVKDDGINPTASLKDRASAMAVAKAGEAGAKIIACSSTGNAASSLAGNAAAAGFKTYIFVPERAPKGKVAQLMIFGANVISVKGNYEETFKMSAEAIEKWGAMQSPAPRRRRACAAPPARRCSRLGFPVRRGRWQPPFRRRRIRSIKYSCQTVLSEDARILLRMKIVVGASAHLQKAERGIKPDGGFV